MFHKVLRGAAKVLLIQLQGRDDGLRTHWEPCNLCSSDQAVSTASRNGEEEEHSDLDCSCDALALAEFATTRALAAIDLNTVGTS